MSPRVARPVRPGVIDSSFSKKLRDGHLAVTCWCQDCVMEVPADDVRAGLTRSCGAPDCTPPREDVL